MSAGCSAGHPHGEAEFLKNGLLPWSAEENPETAIFCGRCCCMLHMMDEIQGNQSQDRIASETWGVVWFSGLCLNEG